jgi:hypothetical protein
MKTKPLDTVQPAHDVAARLATEFDGLLPPELVTRIVMEAICDLYGQVQPKAFPELLHRLAHYRLDIRVRQSSSPAGQPCPSALALQRDQPAAADGVFAADVRVQIT